MMPALVPLLAMFGHSFRTPVALQAEILALRHQLLIFQRKNQKQRLRLSVADRLLWVWLSRVWTDWRSALGVALRSVPSGTKEQLCGHSHYDLAVDGWHGFGSIGAAHLVGTNP